MELFQSIPIDRGDETIRAALSATINRARANHLTTAGWSLAELHLDDEDVDWLQKWARALDEATAKSWLLPDSETGVMENQHARRAAIGVLLLLLTAEQTRRVLSHESDWATAHSLSFNEETRQLLFSNNQPTELHLDTLMQASQRLHLRQNGGWATPKSERGNIALQIALTESDLRERWPQWLNGAELPGHIERLLDAEQGSPSFLQLWQGCQNYLQGDLVETDLRAALAKSPWILPRWIDSIAASFRLHKRQPAEQPVTQDAQPVQAEPSPTPVTIVSCSELGDIFDAMTPYGGVKTIIRATRAIVARADRLGLRAQPWSLAELRISDYDYLWLQVWVKRLEQPTVWITTETKRRFKIGCETISFRAALGGLLLMWIAETARRNASEDSLWLVISPEHFDQSVAAELFKHNQPSRFSREALTCAVRELNLRHAFDGDSSECWKETVFLQFGFTRQAIKQNFPEWLSGLATSRSVLKLLAAETGSASFQDLWQLLRAFRHARSQDHMTEDRLRELLDYNAWVLSDSADDLISAAQAGREFEAPMAAATPDNFLTAPTLVEDGANGSQFVCRIATDLKLLNLSEECYGLFVAGERHAQLFRQADGSYLAEPSRQIVITSNSSRVSVCLIGDSGSAATSQELVLTQKDDNLAHALGTAQLTANGWRVLAGNETLTVEEARTSLFKIKTPIRRDEQGNWVRWALMEGEEMAMLLMAQSSSITPQVFDSLSGLGAPLSVRSGPYNSPNDEFQVAASVVDYGLIEAVVCESPLSATGRLQLGAGKLLRLKLRRRLEPGEKHSIVWWNENGEVGKLTPDYYEEEPDRDKADTASAGCWWVCRLPETLNRFIAVAIADDGVWLGSWWEDGWAAFLPPIAGREPLFAAALLRWFRLPILSRDALPTVRNLSLQRAPEFLSAWLKDRGLPEWLKAAPQNHGFLSAARVLFRQWWPDIETARFVLLMLADARKTDTLNNALPAVAKLLCRVDPLLLAAVLKAVKGRLLISSSSQLRMQLVGCDTKSECHTHKQELVAMCADELNVSRNFIQTDLLDSAARWVSGYELRPYETANLALATQNEKARLLLALHLLEQI